MLERGAPMADTFTVLGRIVLTREPGHGPDREPQCRVHVGFDVAFHKVSVCLLSYTVGFRRSDDLPRFRPSSLPSFLAGVGAKSLFNTSQLCCSHFSEFNTVPHAPIYIAPNVCVDVCAVLFFITARWWYDVSVLKSTMLRGAIRAGAQEETRYDGLFLDDCGEHEAHSLKVMSNMC